jgi:hypothetical protein
VGPISWPAIRFWFFALLATFLFFLSQRTSDDERKKSEDRLDRRSNELAQLVRTMPPSDFLYAFRDIYEECAAALNAAIAEPPTQDSIQKAICTVCRGLAILAHRFDGASGQSIFAANLMHYRPISKLDTTEMKNVRERLRFCEPEIDVSTLDGVLDLDLNLSTATRTEDREPDRELRPLALPIPKIRKTKIKGGEFCLAPL